MRRMHCLEGYELDVVSGRERVHRGERENQFLAPTAIFRCLSKRTLNNKILSFTEKCAKYFFVSASRATLNCLCFYTSVLLFIEKNIKGSSSYFLTIFFSPFQQQFLSIVV
jgi:hypothetical protein